MRNIPLTWILARVFVYVPTFISQILDFIHSMVLIYILIYFEWCDTENQQLGSHKVAFIMYTTGGCGVGGWGFWVFSRFCGRAEESAHQMHFLRFLREDWGECQIRMYVKGGRKYLKIRFYRIYIEISHLGHNVIKKAFKWKSKWVSTS